MSRLDKEKVAVFILCAAAGLLWAQSAGLFRGGADIPARRAPKRFDFPPSGDQSRPEPIASGFARPIEPHSTGAPRSTVSAREVRIVDERANVVMRLGVSASGAGIWMGRPGAAGEFEAGVESNGLPFFQLYSEGRPGALWSGVEAEDTPSVLFRSGEQVRAGVGLKPGSSSETPFLYHVDEQGQQQQILGL